MVDKSEVTVRLIVLQTVAAIDDDPMEVSYPNAFFFSCLSSVSYVVNALFSGSSRIADSCV
jgi:hypothetical protein